jgi:glycosyltransferase involved in cell wall biosynthesis
MKICYLSPTIARPHGGIRVFFEHCNALAARGHEVTLQVMGSGMEKVWAHIDDRVSMRYGNIIADEFDVVVAGWPPHALVLRDAKIKAKKFFLLQMAEHLFNPNDHRFSRICFEAYRVPFPIIGISRWVEYLVRTEGKRGDGTMYYIGNGVSDDFKPGKKDSEITVLVEGWEPNNHSKDVNRIAAKVAARLKQEYGVMVLTYSQKDRLAFMPEVADEFYHVPTQAQLVKIYQRSHFILKASLLDARSCAPVEAMACGCVPVRGIRHGDDDLIDRFNCLRAGYDEKALYDNAVRLIENPALLQTLSENGLGYREPFLRWSAWGNILEDIFTKG